MKSLPIANSFLINSCKTKFLVERRCSGNSPGFRCRMEKIETYEVLVSVYRDTITGVMTEVIQKTISAGSRSRKININLLSPTQNYWTTPCPTLPHMYCSALIRFSSIYFKTTNYFLLIAIIYTQLEWAPTTCRVFFGVEKRMQEAHSILLHYCTTHIQQKK